MLTDLGAESAEAHGLMDFTEGMEPPPAYDQEDAGSSGLEASDEQEELHGPESEARLVVVEEGDDEEEQVPEPELAAGGAEDEGQGGEGAEGGVGAPGPMDHLDGAACAGVQNPARRQRRRRYTNREVWELENAFQYNPYPDSIERLELARQLGVTEAQVQAWFSNERARRRRYQRDLMLRNMPPPAQGQPVAPGFNGYQPDGFAQAPDGRWAYQVPQPPMAPMPPQPVPPAPLNPALPPPYDPGHRCACRCPYC